MNILDEQIKLVAMARQNTLELKAQRDALLEDWNKDHQELLDELTQSQEGVVGAEDYLRELVLQDYAETGNKAPAIGVGVREVTKLEYDTSTAFTWAIEHRMALKLDVSGFEKIVKVSPLDFVRVYQEPQATIATDLTKVTD